MKQHVWYTLFGFLFLAAAVFADEVKITGLSREAVVKNEPSRAVMGYLNTSYPDIFRNARTVCLPRGSAFEPGRGFSFQIDRECDIYLIVHRRGKPDLPGWTLTPIKTYWGIGATIANEEDVYKKHFKAGRVDIPPHNGKVGKLYGMPHAAVIPCSRKVEPLFRWNWQELGDSSATSLGPNAKQVRILPGARRSVTLRIPQEKIAGNKVFHLRFFARAKKNEVCSVQSTLLRFPFGKEYGIADIWTAIDIPFFLPKNRSGATLKLDFSGTDEILLEEAALYRDTTGIKPVADQVKKFFPGNEWKAAFMGRLQPRFLPIAPGSPLDFSRQVQWVPAGSKGRIIANPNGKAAFEKEPETPVRFRCATMQVSTVRPTSKKEIDQIIADCVRQGYNMIRIMHIPGKAKYQRSGVTIDRAKFIPQNQQEFREYFDEDRLRLLDYLLAEAGKRGIYCFWYLMSSFCGWTDATAAAHWVGRNLQGQQFHAQLYVNPAFRRNWKEGVTYLMNRTNSVNGKKWKDDPVFACVLFMNEQDFRTSPVFLAAFQPEWEKEFGSGAPKLTERLLKSSSATGRKAGKFMQKKAEEMIRFYLKSVREAGYPGLVSHSNLYMRMIDAPGRELLSAADLHTYHGHPGMPLPAGSVPGYPVAAWGKQEIAVCNSSSIREQGTILPESSSNGNSTTPRSSLNSPTRHPIPTGMRTDCSSAGMPHSTESTDSVRMPRCCRCRFLPSIPTITQVSTIRSSGRATRSVRSRFSAATWRNLRTPSNSRSRRESSHPPTGWTRWRPNTRHSFRWRKSAPGIPASPRRNRPTGLSRAFRWNPPFSPAPTEPAWKRSPPPTKHFVRSSIPGCWPCCEKRKFSPPTTGVRPTPRFWKATTSNCC